MDGIIHCSHISTEAFSRNAVVWVHEWWTVTAGMIAGGSGLTPMMQVASRVLADKDDKTQVSATVAICRCSCMAWLPVGSAATTNAHCND